MMAVAPLPGNTESASTAPGAPPTEAVAAACGANDASAMPVAHFGFALAELRFQP